MEHFILTVVLTVGQTGPPVPGKTANVPADSEHRVQKQSTDEQRPTAPLVLINSTKPEVGQGAREQPSNTNTEKPVVIREPVSVTVHTTWWERFSVIFTGLLVTAAGIGGYFANLTLRTMQGQLRSMKGQHEAAKEQLEVMKRQSEAMEEQIRAFKVQTELQAAAMCQWLTLRDWDYSWLQKANRDTSLQVKLSIINGTNFPLRLLGYRFTINGKVSVTEGEAVSHTLVPGETIPVSVWAPITMEQFEQMNISGLTVRISGSIGFIDVLKNRQDQRVTGFLECRRRQTTFTPQISSIEPQEEEET